MEFEFSETIIAVIIIIFCYVVWNWRSSPNRQPFSPKNDDKKKDKDKKNARDSNKPPVKIFFGSQSGTAERFANELAEEAKIYGFDPMVVDLEDYEREELENEQFCVFLMATFGEGEPTDNAAEFYTWLMNEERTDEGRQGRYRALEFAVFALGSTLYEHYCAIGRRVDKRLEEMGAKRLLKHGEGDDNGSLEDDYGEWKQKFWKEARKRYGLDNEKEIASLPAFRPAFVLSLLPDEQKTKYRGGLDSFKGESKLRPVVVPVVANYELRQSTEDGGSTRHIEIDIANNPNITYITADNLGVYPRNDFKLAAKLAKRLGANPKDLFTLKPREGGTSKKNPFPPICSVHDALLWYCDINALAKPKLLTQLLQYSSDEKEKQRMINYTKEGKEAFVADKKSVYEVLEEFPNVKIPLGDFLELIPRMQPRFYTISSSSKVQPNTIAITVTVNREEKPRGRVHLGVCSSYLSSLKPQEDRVSVFVRASSFRLPAQLATPVIMVGPGTGVAPFRAFWHEAQFITKNGGKLGPWWLFFGCRNRNQDWIYRDEMKENEESKVISRLQLAFSREAKDKKEYVQHKLQQTSKELWSLIHKEKAYIYVCGGTAMGGDVRNAIRDCAQRHGDMSAEAATAFVKNLQNVGRYVQELWS